MTTVHERADSNFGYQRKLALSLIDTVGYEGAIRFCQSNAWDGVLSSVMGLQNRSAGSDADAN